MHNRGGTESTCYSRVSFKGEILFRKRNLAIKIIRRRPALVFQFHMCVSNY